MPGRPGALRVTAYLVGLLAVLCILLVLVELLATGVLPRITVGTWRIPAAIPGAGVALVVCHCLYAVANRRDGRA
ncbi:hypothetical protein [Micromonospora sp. WMMD737]|uniref:hypothetical protein n=1 Tax=Micromonospora sp. WMMD737 TaxID=3404113 RepID=UPI003B933EB5